MRHSVRSGPALVAALVIAPVAGAEAAQRDRCVVRHATVLIQNAYLRLYRIGLLSRPVEPR